MTTTELPTRRAAARKARAREAKRKVWREQDAWPAERQAQVNGVTAKMSLLEFLIKAIERLGQRWA
jgi:hypothetical protein